MAVTVSTDFVTLYTGDASFSGQETYSGFQRFGNGCNGAQVSNGTDHYTETIASFSLVGRAIYTWMVGPGSIDTIANGGYRIVIGDGTNTRAYFVGGRDYKSFSSQGWFCFMLQGDNLPTQYEQLAGAAEPNVSAITTIGIGFTTTSKAVGNSPNCFFDVMRHGTGLTISGGTELDPGKFDEIRILDDSINNAWGIIESLGGNTFGIQGKLTFGNETEATYFKDENALLNYGNRVVAESFYSINLLGSTTQNNTFILGEKTGEGDAAAGINGCTITSPNIGVNIDFTDVNMDVVNIYGTTFSNLGNIDILLSNNSEHEFISNNVVNSGQLIANEMYIRNLNVISSAGKSLLNSNGLLWDDLINIARSTFIANENAIEHPDSAGSPYSYNSLNFTNNTYDIINTSGLAITVNAFEGSNPTSFNPSGDDVTINNPTTFTVANIVPNSEVRIFRHSDREELAGVESSNETFQYDYNYSGNVLVYVVVHKENYEYIKISDITLTEADQTITVQQRIDRNYIGDGPIPPP